MNMHFSNRNCPTCGKDLEKSDNWMMGGHFTIGLFQMEHIFYRACAEHFDTGKPACKGKWEEKYGLMAEIWLGDEGPRRKKTVVLV